MTIGEQTTELSYKLTKACTIAQRTPISSGPKNGEQPRDTQDQPNVIAPRSIGTVEVHSTPFPVGEKLVSVTLHTDSHLSPTGELRLRVFGWRGHHSCCSRGPNSSTGLTPSARRTRELTVLNVELSGSKPRQPLIESELPFLQFTTPVIDEQPYSDPTTVQRTYRYKVKLLFAASSELRWRRRGHRSVGPSAFRSNPSAG